MPWFRRRGQVIVAIDELERGRRAEHLAAQLVPIMAQPAPPLDVVRRMLVAYHDDEPYTPPMPPRDAPEVA